MHIIRLVPPDRNAVADEILGKCRRLEQAKVPKVVLFVPRVIEDDLLRGQVCGYSGPDVTVERFAPIPRSQSLR